MSAPRIGLIGARRERQGLGPFVARDLRAAGAEVPCFLATSAATRDAARRLLERNVGIDARGYLDLEEMLGSEELDALAILSPSETHHRYLDAAVSAGLHALCEKPLVWGEPGLAAAARRVVDAFDARGLALWENCQWPYTLAAFARLHPDAPSSPPRRFEMWLEPVSRGAEMLGDCLPHALSLLQALAPGPDGRIEDPRFSTGDPATDRLELEFRFRSGNDGIDVRIELRHSDTTPRNAGYALDGRRASRLVSGDDYRLSFEDGDRRVPMADPLPLLVADFVAAIGRATVRGGDRSRDIVQRMGLIETLVIAHRDEAGDTT